jgi:hypothetical protein
LFYTNNLFGYLWENGGGRGAEKQKRATFLRYSENEEKLFSSFSFLATNGQLLFLFHFCACVYSPAGQLNCRFLHSPTLRPSLKQAAGAAQVQ